MSVPSWKITYTYENPKSEKPRTALTPGGAQQSRHDRVRHLVFEDVGRPVPLRVDDDLRIGQIRQRVEPDLLQGVDGQDAKHHDREQGDVPVDRAVLDDAPDEGVLPRPSVRTGAVRIHLPPPGPAGALLSLPLRRLRRRGGCRPSGSARRAASIPSRAGNWRGPRPVPPLLCRRGSAPCRRRGRPTFTSRGSKRPSPMSTNAIRRTPVSISAESGTTTPVSPPRSSDTSTNIWGLEPQPRIGKIEPHFQRAGLGGRPWGGYRRLCPFASFPGRPPSRASPSVPRARTAPRIRRGPPRSRRGRDP